MVSFFKKNKYSFIFFLLFVVICLLYQYHVILFLRPQGYHPWRQTICLSIAFNYYQHGMNFFMPEVHNLFSDGGTSGQSQAEFPIIYYFNAALWKIFGVHEFIPRLVNILICLLGSFYLFKLIARILAPAWAIMITLLFFTSPVIVFYANNFLVDIPVLFIWFISAYYFFNYYESGKAKDIYIFMLLSILCMLLKPPGGTFFLAVLGVYILEKLRIIRFEKKIFKNSFRDASLFIITLVIVAAWFSYAFHFNSIHGGSFITSYYPIWDFNSAEIGSVTKDFFEYMFPQFFYSGTAFIFLFLFICTILLYKKIEKIYIVMTILLVFGALAHAVLWFQLLDNHDYYMFVFFLPVVFAFISFGNFLKTHHTNIFHARKTKIIFFLFLVYNVWYCGNNIRMRYGIAVGDVVITSTKTEIGLWDWFNWDHRTNWQAYETIEPFNRRLGIQENDLVISIPDESICISLYLMNQRGWTKFGNHFENKDVIEKKIKQGAKYLFVRDSTEINKEALKQFLQNKIGQYRNISIYKLKEE